MVAKTVAKKAASKGEKMVASKVAKTKTLSQLFAIVLAAAPLASWADPVDLVVTLVAVIALIVVAYTWLNEYQEIHTKSSGAGRAWFWIALGVIGTALFACRFLVQWYATEKQGKSVVPTSFWSISVVAAVMQSASFVQQEEWVYAIGVASNLPVYLRNLYLIKTRGEAPAGA